MINTYQTSMAPPPVPPRLNRSDPILIPAPLPPKGHSRSLTHFLIGVVLLHLFLSVGGFIILYENTKLFQARPNHPQTAASVADYYPSEKQEASHRTLARMVVEQQRHTPGQKRAPGYLQWDMNQSFCRNVNYYKKSWLTILQAGDYYVYSSVTFSKGDSQSPLASKIKLKENEAGEEKTVMQAFCHLSGPHLCTASQGEVITLEIGNQLSVWVQDLSVVNYEQGATTFGMYKL